VKVTHDSISVEWDNGDFHFGVEPDDMSLVENIGAPSCAVGATFLSGKKSNHVSYVRKDGSIEEFMVFGETVWLEADSFENLSSGDDWSICGPGVADSRLVSDLCQRTKALTVTVNPLNRYQEPFGHLVGALTMMKKAKPRMTRFCKPYDESVDAEGKDYDPKLEGDGYGKMAHLVQARTPVVNQIMSTPSIPAFYGRILSTGIWWGNPIFLMLQRTATNYFPTELLSVRNYASTWVPVSVYNTEKFSKASGYGGNRVKIFIASELTPGLGTFLRFIESMSKDDFAVSSDPKDMPIPKSIPLFRYRSAYNIDEGIFKEVVLES
jgi:hypothetical protein